MQQHVATSRTITKLLFGTFAALASAPVGAETVTIPTTPATVPRGQYVQGTNYYRPYSLVPRPVFRARVGSIPIRRMTFSLGYLSYGNTGAYYY